MGAQLREGFRRRLRSLCTETRRGDAEGFSEIGSALFALIANNGGMTDNEYRLHMSLWAQGYLVEQFIALRGSNNINTNRSMGGARSGKGCAERDVRKFGRPG